MGVFFLISFDDDGYPRIREESRARQEGSSVVFRRDGIAWQYDIGTCAHLLYVL